MIIGKIDGRWPCPGPRTFGDRLLEAAWEALPAQARVVIGRFRLIVRAADLADEWVACRRRRDFGRRGWLLSWHRDPEGLWQARLSGPGLARTIERSASSRGRAIERSARAMGRIPKLRARIGPRTFPDAGTTP